MNVLIPMAGEGRRLKDLGYSIPKPFISVINKSMIQIVVDYLKYPGNHFIFACKKKHIEKYDLYNYLKNIVENFTFDIVSVDKTEGAAHSCLYAKDFINNNKGLLIVNAD